MSKPSTGPQRMNLKQTLQQPANSVRFLTNTNLVEIGSNGDNRFRILRMAIESILEIWIDPRP